MNRLSNLSLSGGLLLMASGSLLNPCLGEVSPNVGPNSAAHITTVPNGAVTSACLSDASASYEAANYYVDSLRGNDSHSGTTSSSAWKTLAKALTAPAPAVIHVLPGTYGVLVETTPIARTGYLTIRPDPSVAAGNVVLRGININYPNGIRTAAKLRVIGFTIKPEDFAAVNGAVVTLKNVKDFELHANVITTNQYAKATSRPGAPSMFDGINVDNTDGLLIKSNKITSVFRGIQVASSFGTVMQCNYIRPENGSAIQYLSKNIGGMIVDNHIRGGANLLYDSTCTTGSCLDAPDINHAHSSMISIRSGDLTIRNNVMHGMGTTAGIRFYPPDVAGELVAYSNVLIEGNQIYDVHNSSVLQLLNSAEQIAIRNNVIISHLRPGTCADGAAADARYRYETALRVTVAAGYDGSGINIENNVFVGAAFVPSTVVERANIMWSYSVDNGMTWSATTPSGTSKIITSTYKGCGRNSSYFETDFFEVAPNLLPKHGHLLNLKPALGSDAAKMGGKRSNPLRTLGDLDPSAEFVRNTLWPEPAAKR